MLLSDLKVVFLNGKNWQIGRMTEDGWSHFFVLGFYPDDDYSSAAVKFRCPICHFSEIVIRFFEDKVVNCKGKIIDERFPTICDECQAKINGKEIWEMPVNISIIEKALGVKL